VLALAVCAGFTVLALLGVVGHDAPRAAISGAADRPGSSTAKVGLRPASEGKGEAKDRAARVVGQDGQDRPGTEAHRRARREARRHRALQHVPWRGIGVSIKLGGAKDGNAVLVVEGPSLSAAHRGWRRFLHRYRDDGRSYLPRFRGGRGTQR
jgi:hypothetical protein